MSELYSHRLRSLAALKQPTVLTQGRRGIEKESLRISSNGEIAQTPHPEALGSALTHRFITTDYSEALLEFVTPPQAQGWAASQFLCDIHATVYPKLNDELLWPFSMPCRLTTDADIPIARYGSSNVGRMKNIYREGLGQRYGRFMQVISGIHFNYSMPDEFWEPWQEIEQSQANITELKSSTYLGLVRTVRRLDWLLLYLFGASPAVCSSFLKGNEGELSRMRSATLYGEHATSLRMSDIGYQNSSQAALHVSANSLDEYVKDLSAAVATPDPEYLKLGIKQAATICSSMRISYRLRMSTTARSGPSASRFLESARQQPCSVLALNTLNCERSISVRLIRWASAKRSRSFSKLSSFTLC